MKNVWIEKNLLRTDLMAAPLKRVDEFEGKMRTRLENILMLKYGIKPEEVNALSDEDLIYYTRQVEEC